MNSMSKIKIVYFKQDKSKYEREKEKWSTKEAAFKQMCDGFLCFYTLEYEDAAKKLTKERMKAD